MRGISNSRIGCRKCSRVLTPDFGRFRACYKYWRPDQVAVTTLEEQEQATALETAAAEDLGTEAAAVVNPMEQAAKELNIPERLGTDLEPMGHRTHQTSK